VHFYEYVSSSWTGRFNHRPKLAILAATFCSNVFNPGFASRDRFLELLCYKKSGTTCFLVKYTCGALGSIRCIIRGRVCGDWDAVMKVPDAVEDRGHVINEGEGH
jgi:hypothetical protein